MKPHHKTHMQKDACLSKLNLQYAKALSYKRHPFDCMVLAVSELNVLICITHLQSRCASRVLFRDVIVSDTIVTRIIVFLHYENSLT